MDIVERLRGAYSTVFERSLAKEAADEIERLRRERDLAIAHDRQPYPTADAYEKVCVARTKWQDRAERAEAERDALRSVLQEIVGQEKPNRWGYDAAYVALDETWREKARTLLLELKEKK